MREWHIEHIVKLIPQIKGVEKLHELYVSVLSAVEESDSGD